MKDINFGKAINYAVSQPTVNVRESKADPLRPNFGYLKTSELPFDKGFPARAIPSHPEKNPKGYIIKEMYQFPDELDMVSTHMHKHKCRFVMVPSCYKAGADDFMITVYKRINDLLSGETNREFLPGNEEEGTKDRFVFKPGETELTKTDQFLELLNTNPEFKMFLTVLSKRWVQVIVPVLLYAQADEYQDGKYTRHKNYRPDKDQENYLCKLMQFNYSKALDKDFLRYFEEVVDDDSVEDHTPWNDELTGNNFIYIREAKGHKFKEGKKKSVFDEDMANKFAGNPDYYPNLIERELKNSYKPEAIKAALKDCPKHLVKHLIDFGILDSD